jgi:hypothetical protein
MTIAMNASALRSDLDLELPLHPATDNAEHVATLLSRLLGVVEEFTAYRDASAADVVQALTVATALRSAMAEVDAAGAGPAHPRLMQVDVQQHARAAL